MKYSFLSQVSFESTHQSEQPERCAEPHGHRFTVVAVIEHEQMDEGMPRGARGFERVLEALCGEFADRSLADLLPGGIQQTLPGMAAYFFERLVALYPGLKSVGVFDGKATGTVERE